VSAYPVNLCDHVFMPGENGECRFCSHPKDDHEPLYVGTHRRSS
jgi:hypothetical protein